MMSPRLPALLLSAFLGVAPLSARAEEPAAPVLPTAPAGHDRPAEDAVPGRPPEDAGRGQAPTNPFQDPTLADRLIAQSEEYYFKHEYVDAMRALETALQFAPAESRRALESALSYQAEGNAAGPCLTIAFIAPRDRRSIFGPCSLFS